MSWWVLAGVIGLAILLVAEAVVIILVLRAMANGWPHPRGAKGGKR